MQFRISAVLLLYFLGVLVVPHAMADEKEHAIVDITWTLGPNLPEFRKGGCATVLGDKLISVFGMRQPWGEMETMYIYEPQENWWHRGPEAPVGQCYVHGTEHGGAFYVVGGRGALQRGRVHPACYRLQLTDGRYQWDRIADLQEPRGWAPSASVGDKIYVFGGSQGGHGPTLNSVEMLDTSQPDAKWVKVADIPGPSRGWSGAAAVGGKLYLLGGSHFYHPKPKKGDDRTKFDEVWQLDPTTHTWQSRSPLPYRLSGFDCVVYRDRYVIAVGGAHYNKDLPTRTARNKSKRPVPQFVPLPVRAGLRYGRRPLAGDAQCDAGRHERHPCRDPRRAPLCHRRRERGAGDQ